jgi:hypothetical protein
MCTTEKAVEGSGGAYCNAAEGLRKTTINLKISGIRTEM